MANARRTAWRGVVTVIGGGMGAARVPTRVLMILDTFSFGGAENLVAELARCASGSLEISAASLAPQEPDRDAMAGRLAEAGLDPQYLTVRRLLDPTGLMKLVATLRRSAADVVHAHLDYSATVVPLAARLAGKPVVATLHVSPQRDAGWRTRLKERLSVRIPARFGRLVFVSRHIYDEYARLHGPARPTWRVIPNGVDLDRYTVGGGGHNETGPVWAMVAAMRPDKNHRDLITAWAAVVARHPDATLLIVGDGPTRSATEAAVTNAGLDGAVRFLGRREDVPAILGRVDGVVSASVDEALPTALIEAGACGLPVVAADAGGTREIVVDGLNGRLVPVRDVPALTEALLSVIENPERAAEYGKAARARVEEMYSVPVWVERLEALYAEVIGER